MSAPTVERERAGSGCPRGIFTIDADLSTIDADRAIAYYPVRGPVWTAVDNVYRTIFVEGKDGVIAFDTFDTPGAARSYQRTIGRILPRKEIHTVIYSHDHLDHTGYAVNLAPEADIVAHELCAKMVQARGSDGQLVPTQTFAGERREYELDGIAFELLYPGPTHGDGNIAAHFPEQRILFMVDMMAAGVAYTFYPDWHWGPDLVAMRRLLGLDWDLFVPGHFWPMSREDFIEDLDYQERLAEHAQAAIAESVDADDFAEVEAYAETHLEPEFAGLFRYYEYGAQNLLRAMQHFLMGGWGFEGNARPPSEPFAPTNGNEER